MSSWKNGKNRAAEILRIAIHNQAFELAILALWILAYCLKGAIEPVGAFFHKTLPAFYSGDKISLMVSAASVMLGIYVAVISIIATSILGITGSMIQKGRHHELLQVFSFGMVDNVLLILLCVLDGAGTVWGAAGISLLFALSAVSFLNFVRLIGLIFLANLKAMTETINERQRAEERMFTILNKIEEKLK